MSTNFLNGSLDEVRVSLSTRSADWIASQFNNQNSPNTFYTIAAAESASGLAQLHWLVTDQLGTPRMVFDQTGSLANTSRHDYLPFGEELFAGTGGRTAAQGYSASDNVRWKFAQKERDNETGLDYFGARYYASLQGRFTGTDPVISGISRLNDPQRLNLYAHARQNPLKYIDADGRDITPTNAQSAAQLRADLDQMLTAAEAANIRVEAGKNISLLDRNAIKPADASPAYRQLLIAIAPGVQRYYTSVATNDVVATRDGGTVDVKDGITVFEGTNNPDGSNATVIEIFVPSTDGPKVWGKDGSPIDLPRFMVTGHETLGHATCGVGRCAVVIENQIRRSLGLPPRDGSDHEKLPSEPGILRVPPTSVEITSPSALIETRDIQFNTQPVMQTVKRPEP